MRRLLAGIVVVASTAVPTSASAATRPSGLTPRKVPGYGVTVSLPGGPSTDVDLNESANLATAVGGPPPPTSKAECKHGGWKNFPQFKNQGQCVRFVNSHDKKHHHKHHPSGLPVRVWES